MTQAFLCVSTLGLAWLLAQPGSTPVLRRAVISGRVASTEAFARQLSGDLWFCLHPDADNSGSTYGWRIQIGPACDRSAPSFTIVTPPLHGPNPTAIDAWHFDPGVNAPGRVRDFSFVLKREDYDAILTTLNSGADADTVTSEFDRLGRGHGVLRVIRFARHKNAAGQSVFDWLEFRAELRQR
jgi:hypothetical protein